MQSELVASAKETDVTMNVNEAVVDSGKETAESKKEKYAKKVELNKSILQFLSEKFPACFDKDNIVKPLKLGIFQDIVDNAEVSAAYSKTNIRAALRYYTMSWRYLDAVAKGGERVDLHGQAAGQVDEQQMIHAQEQLVEAKAKVKARQDKNKSSQDAQKKKRFTPPSPTFKKKASPKTNSNGSKPKTQKNLEKAPPTNASSSSKFTPKPILASELTLGKEVNVLIGQSYSKAQLLEINKDNVRVILPTGLTLNVKIDNLSE